MDPASIPFCIAADRHPKPPRIQLPDNSCDCHAHIFGSLQDYPVVENRIYTPAPAFLDDYETLRQTLGIERSVIVQPSVYGTDNRATMDAVKAGGDDYRAVVVVAPDISLPELRVLHKQGARGVRINIVFGDTTELEALQLLAGKLAELDWHMQLLVDISRFSGFESFIAKLPVPVVLDHMGHMPVDRGINAAEFITLLKLLESGQCWVKLSGAYRLTNRQNPPYEDVAPFARALIQANPERMLWATDWPHPHIPVAMPNDGDLVDMFEDWLANSQLREQIYVLNPASLYGFEKS